ncbi:MAG TPA: NifU family protein [Blastocatellia bacterium]|nr:NifU family protein [Blastocatellia bacterium]
MSQTVEGYQRADVQRDLRKIEELVQLVESVTDPRLRAGAVELVQTLMSLHGSGIERMVELVFESGETGRALIDDFANDHLVSSLLLLYGLHPLPLEARVRQALERVRPRLHSHRGDVELVGVVEGVVRLRLLGSCHGCASSAMTLKLAIEEAIYEAAPDLAGLEVEGVIEQPPVPSGLVQLQRSPN